LRFGLRSNNPEALAEAAPHLPLGWQPTPTGEVDIFDSGDDVIATRIQPA
jgi:hypothetical protein